MAITTQMRTDVANLYVALFGRAPERDGLGYWVQQLDAGKTVAQIAQDMYNTTPARAFYPEFLTNEEVIGRFYTNVLGRTADADGLAYWTAKLTAGQSKGSVIAEMITAVTSFAGTGDDALSVAARDSKALFTNKVTVGLYYAVDLGGNDVAAASSILTSVTKEAASVTTAKDAASSAAGQSYTLTTGINTVPGTIGNDTINAGLDTGAMTFSSLDNIDGAGGTDTMNLVATGALTGAAGATVKNVEIVNLTSAAAITAADVSGWTGLQTLNIASGGNIAGVVAAATTDVNVGAASAGVTVNGGKNVTISNSTAGNISVGATTAAAGNVTATNSFATGTVGVKGAGALTATANDGAITFTNGTSVNATASQAVALATRTANAAAKTAADAADTAAQADSDASGLAKVAAAAVVTALDTLKTAIAAATNVSADATTANSIQAATTAAYQADAITAADKIAIDAAFKTGLVTSTAAARTAAQAVLTPLQTAAKAASDTAAAADLVNDATAAAAKAAAAAVVTADTAKAGLVDGVTVAATTNTALASATVKGNYGATGVGTGAAFANAITDGSTLQNTLTTVTLENAGASEITGLAVTNVSATGMANSVTVVNATANHTQNFALSGVTAGTYTDANATTVNVVSNGSATNVLTGLSATLPTAVNLTGEAGLTFGTTTFAAAAVIDASGSSGKNTITVGAGQTYKGGSGADVVTTNGGALQTKTVDGGAGSADRLNLAAAADFATTGAAKFTNFEIISLASGLSADVSKFTGSTFTSAIVNGGAASLTGLNATQAGAITATANGTYTIGVAGATTVGQLDTVKITVDDGATAVGNITLTTPVLAGVETLNLVANENVTVTALTSATALTNVNVTGAGDVSITSGALALNVNSVIDASAATGDVTLNFAAATANGISLKAGDGDNTLTGTDIAGKGNAFQAGNGDNSITGGQADDVITLGNGNNTVSAANGNNTVTVGNGDNAVTTGTGADTITVGNGWNVIVSGAGADTIVTGTGGNLVTAGAGADKITFGAHVAGVIDGLVMAAAGDTWTGASIVSGTTDLTGVDIVTGIKAGDTIDLSALSATFTGAAGTTIAAAVTTTVSLVKGNFDAATQVWTTSASGTDTLVVYDADAAAGGLGLEAIVLVGSLVTGTVDSGILTLA